MDDFKSLTMTCCGHTFGMRRQLYNQLLDNGEDWYCPGCGKLRVFIHTWKKAYEDKCAELKRCQNTNSHFRGDNQTLRHRLRSQKSATTRMKNKIKLLKEKVDE